ncbi:MAG: tetratricopeptide repeat protein [Spirochaetaceae bacterium]|nr:tetratricopeptide repeat protein [Spirochaetaceae bacterium]
MKCYYCDQEMADDAVVCPHCGKQTEKTKEAEKVRKAKAAEDAQRKREEREAAAAAFARRSKIAAVVVVIAAVAAAVLLGIGTLIYFTVTKNDRAIAGYSKQIAAEPANAGLYLQRGSFYLERNSLDEAKQDFAKALELNPALDAEVESRAASFAETDRQKADEQAYNKAIFLYTLLLGRMSAGGVRAKSILEKRADLYARHDFNAAYSDYSAIINAQPDNFNVLQKRAAASFANNNLRLAEADYSAIINHFDNPKPAVNSDTDAEIADDANGSDTADNSDIPAVQNIPAVKNAPAEIYRARGDVYAAMKDNGRAVEDYSVYLQKETSGTDEQYLTLEKRAVLYSDAEKYAEAAADYSAIINGKSEYAFSYIGDGGFTLILKKRGDVYYKLGNYNNAVSDYTKALTVDENSRSILLSRADAYTALKEYDKAIDDYSLILKSDKKDDWAHALRGINHYLNGKYGKALSDLDDAIKYDGTFAIYYGWRGDVHSSKGRDALLFGSGDYKKAAEDYTKALEIAPDEPDYYASRGKAYFFLKYYPRALRDFDEAIRRDSSLAAKLAEYRNECLKH